MISRLNNTKSRHLVLTKVLKSVHIQANSSSVPTKPVERNRLRNIGIVAHINAGKTTTTERILYHAGSTRFVGDVDRGNTVTDYLEQERNRGITITSAAVTYNWKKHRINLIDTPGHVDFTIEVERSLSVLDGAVTILDASAGVEAQTITVWNQAAKYKLPNVIFLNKYDKPQADYTMCMKDIKETLNLNAKLVQIPIETKGGFLTIIDVINRQCFSWTDPSLDHGSKFQTESLAKCQLDKKHLELVEETREKLINCLTDIDEDLADHALSCDKISQVSGDSLAKAIRKATISCQLCPVLIGSSFKYVGVQQLMDAIVNYLPSPLDREYQLRGSTSINEPSKTSKTCLFIFKITHDNRLGPLSYVKVCNGTLVKQQRLLSLSQSQVEQVKRIYRVFADELQEIETPVCKDDIVVISGLDHSRTGDILVDQNFRPKISSSDKLAAVPLKLLDESIIVPQINQMEPVYHCSVESRTVAHQLKLEHALNCISREDPSFTYEIDEVGITTIRGMGKLHLEVTRDRIESEYGIDPILGPLQISYRETIDGSAIEELSVNKLVNSIRNVASIRISLCSKQNAGVWTAKMLKLDTNGDNSLGRLRSDHRKAIESGFLSALSHGPLKGYPLIDCSILLLDFTANGRCSLPVISSIASQCLSSAIKRCSPILLEPIMLLEVVAPKEFSGSILRDIASRRGLVLSTVAKNDNTITIRSQTPLAALGDYSEFLMVSTSGRGSFSLELHSYARSSDTSSPFADY